MSEIRQEGFCGGSDGKESACNAREPGLVPGLGRPPGAGNENPPQYFRLENPMDRGAWWAIVHRVTKSRTQLKQLNTYMIQATVNKDLAKNNTHKDCSSI